MCRKPNRSRDLDSADPDGGGPELRRASDNPPALKSRTGTLIRHTPKGIEARDRRNAEESIGADNARLA
jgi:hypothetical protein